MTTALASLPTFTATAPTVRSGPTTPRPLHPVTTRDTPSNPYVSHTLAIRCLSPKTAQRKGPLRYRSGPPRSKEMAQLGCRSRQDPDREYSHWDCPQATAPLTFLTPLSNITLDTGSPPFTGCRYPQAATDLVFVKRFYATRAAYFAIAIRNGIKARISTETFTNQSAAPSDTQNGTSGPKPSSGT